MALNPAVRTSGHFFQPFSELEDGESLACHYLPIYRDKDGKREYPLSVVLGMRHFSIYWSGYMFDETREFYGVHQLFSDDFTDEYNEPINNWLEDAKLIPMELLDKHSQKALGIKNAEETALPAVPGNSPPRYTIGLLKDKGYRSVYFTGSTDEKQDVEQKKRKLFDNFLLDLLFDLEHSSAFRAHPSRERFIGFLQKVPRIKAIWLKAEYRYNLKQLGLCQVRHYRDPETERKQLQYWAERGDASTAQWLGYLRSPEGESGAKDSKTDTWFLGVEAEHRSVFLSSKAEHLDKQAEDSIQWLINRYALGHAYWLQTTRVFGLKNLAISALSFAIIYLVHTFCPTSPISGMIAFASSLWEESSRNHWAFRGLLALSGVIIFLLIGLIGERSLMIGINLIGLPFNKYLPWKFFEKANPEAVLLSIPKIANLLKPKILLASAAAWALILSTDFVWDLDFQLSLTKWVILGLLALVTFIFMATHIAPLLERKNKGWKVLFRIFILGFFSSIYSFMIGLVGMAATAEKRFIKDEQLPQYFEEFQIKEHKGDFASNTDGNYIYLGDTSNWKQMPEFAPNTISLATIFEKEDSTGKMVYEKELSSSKWLTYRGLPAIYHHCRHEKADSIACLHKKACLIKQADFSLDKDHSLDVHHLIIIVAEPLVFFTFVAVALGLMLEMGLQLNRAGIGIE